MVLHVLSFTYYQTIILFPTCFRQELGEKSAQLLSDEERQDDHMFQEHKAEDNDAM